MLRVLQFSLAYAPSWKNGGPPRVMFDYAKELTRRGCQVTAYTADFSKAGREAMGAAWPAEIRVEYFRTKTSPLAAFNSQFSMRELARWFDRELPNFDVVHLGQTRTLANVVLHRAARRHGVPLVLSAFGSLPRRREGLKTVYDKLFVNPLVHEAAGLLAQTAHEMDVYRAFGGREDQIALVPLAFDRSTFETLPPRGAFRAELGIDADAPLALFLGRLHRTKGIEGVVRAFARVVAREPRARLAIVGHDCGAEAEVRAEIARAGLDAAVSMTPPRYGGDRLQAYVDADAYVITPSVYEETPLAAIEALACGTPVVTTERADVPWLQSSGIGHVVPPGDVEACAAGVMDLMSRARGNRDDVRARTRAFAHQHFEIHTVGERLHQALLRATRTADQAHAASALRSA